MTYFCGLKEVKYCNFTKVLTIKQQSEQRKVIEQETLLPSWGILFIRTSTASNFGRMILRIDTMFSFFYDWRDFFKKMSEEIM